MRHPFPATQTTADHNQGIMFACNPKVTLHPVIDKGLYKVTNGRRSNIRLQLFETVSNGFTSSITLDKMQHVVQIEMFVSRNMRFE